MEKVEIKKEDLTHEIKEEPVKYYEVETKDELADVEETVVSAGPNNATAKKKHECTVCGKEFERVSHLKKHSMIHSGEKPFKCDTCGKCFNQKGSLNQHEMTHTGEKRFKCEVCGKSFSEHSNLKSHNLIHSGEKPFECVECGQRFNRSTHL